MTPQISGKYQFQVDLKGLCLPVTFTVPDIPDAPPSEERFDRGAIIEETRASEETCNITQRAHTDPRDSTVRAEIDKQNLLHVSAYTVYSVNVQLDIT